MDIDHHPEILHAKEQIENLIKELEAKGFEVAMIINIEKAYSYPSSIQAFERHHNSNKILSLYNSNYKYPNKNTLT